MMERIGCKDCISTKCEGCNMLTLERMLNSGKLDCLMDEPHCVNQNAEVGVVKHGRWADVGYKIRCSLCDHGVFLGTTDPVAHNYEKENLNYCPHCGAKMDGKSCVPRTEDGGAENAK